MGKLYFREGWNGAEKLLFDPSAYKTGVTTTIETIVPSIDGRHVVMGLSAGGAEYSELRVLDVDRGALLPGSIYPSYGAIGWTLDSESFFYDAGKVTDIKSLGIELNRKTRIHRLGTPVAADPDFFSDEADPELGIAPKEFPEASVDESYPRLHFRIRQHRAERDARVLRAHLRNAEREGQMGRALPDVGQSGPGHGIHGGLCLCDYP